MMDLTDESIGQLIATLTQSMHKAKPLVFGWVHTSSVSRYKATLQIYVVRLVLSVAIDTQINWG